MMRVRGFVGVRATIGLSRQSLSSLSAVAYDRVKIWSGVHELLKAIQHILAELPTGRELFAIVEAKLVQGHGGLCGPRNSPEGSTYQSRG